MGSEQEARKSKLEKSYFDVLGLCCSSEVPLIENILKPLEGIKEVSVIVPSRTVIVVHDALVISHLQIAKALNQARLEANIRVYGDQKHQMRWPSPYALICGLLFSVSLFKFLYPPLKYVALAAVAAGIVPIVLKAFVSIRNLRLDINILMIIAVIGTIVMDDYLEAGTIVFLFSIAEWLETRAGHRATAVMSSLMNIAPQKAVIAETGEAVDADEVKVNTIIAVRAGEVIPIDGVVFDGNCEVDEKTLTGESFPVPKQKDSTVWAGTINLNGYISVKTTALAEDCVVAKMAKLVEEAQNSKTSTQRLIDKFAKYYTPAIVIISALIAAIPFALRVHDHKHWIYFALVVLVSACPCALVISTPVATFCAYTKAATSGLLIKGGDHLETLSKIKVVAFDKTGTITKGDFVVTNFLSLSDDIDLNTLIYWVSSIESKSSHPLAEAIVDYGRSRSVEPKPENVSEFENFPGEGICGKIDSRVLYIGNKKIGARAGSETVPTIQGEAQRGKTTGYIYSGATPIGFFSLSDNCRTGAQEAIRKLKSIGTKTAMLTGDSQASAIQAQQQLGNALDLVHAELLPEDKLKIVTEFKKEGPTAMVGDGVNDAPALAAADIGISMGISGSALASDTGNIILMSNDLRKIPEAIKLARESHRKVIQNIFLSVITKVAIVALAIAGHPIVWAAVLADVGTCVVVILNSMLLLREGHKHDGGKCSARDVHKNGCDGHDHVHDHNHHHHHHHHDHDHDHNEHVHDHHHHHHHHDHDHEHEHVHIHDHDHHHHHDHDHEHVHVHDHHHEHDNDHDHDHHQHHDHDHDHCSSDKTEQMAQPQNCASQTCSSTKCKPCPSKSSLGGTVKHLNVVEGHDHCKGSPEHHEPDHHHHDRDIEHKHCSHSHSSSTHAKDHGTEHCHTKDSDKVSHHYHKASSHKHCHMASGCNEIPKDNEYSRQKSVSNHDSGTSEISIEITELGKDKEDSCCKGCTDACEKLPVISSCCKNERSSSMECSKIVHACMINSLERRGGGGCCSKSYMKECCGGKHGEHYSGAGFVAS